MSKRIIITVDDDLFDRIDKAAKVAHLKRAAWVRETILAHIEKPWRSLDVRATGQSPTGINQEGTL